MSYAEIFTAQVWRRRREAEREQAIADEVAKMQETCSALGIACPSEAHLRGLIEERDREQRTKHLLARWGDLLRRLGDA